MALRHGGLSRSPLTGQTGLNGIVETASFIRSLPKAELHVHIEGTLEPEMMFALVARNGIDLPFDTVGEVREAYEFSDLQTFLDIYYRGRPSFGHNRTSTI